MTKRRTVGIAAVVVLVTSAGLVVTPAQRQATADTLLGAALHQADVEGNFEAAIATYQQVLGDQTADRRTLAAAHLGLGQAYERLGKSEAARPHYEQVATRFTDQPQAAAGRLGLARLPNARGSQAAVTGDRAVWAGKGTIDQARVSRDGRFVVHTDWDTGSLMLQDLETRRTRVLADSNYWAIGNSYEATFSPDGKQVAYGWRTNGEKAHVDELRVVNIDGAGAPQPRRLYGNTGTSAQPSDWSSDGRSLAVLATHGDGSRQIAVIGVSDGSYRGLKTVGWRGPRLILFSPDTRYLAYDLPASHTDLQRDVFIAAADGSGETRLDHPSNDVLMGWSPDGRQLLFASDRSSTLGLWSVSIADGRPQTAARLLKPDIGSVSSLGLTASGALHLVKDASTVSLQIAPIDLEAGRLSGPPVVAAFRSEYPTWSPDGKELSYASTGVNGMRVVAIRTVDSGTVREIRPPLFYFRQTPWLPDGRSVVTFASDLNGRSGIHRIDLSDGRTTLLVPDAEIAAVQLSPDGRKLYHTVGYFSPDQGPARFVERDLASGEVREVFRASAGSTGLSRLSPDGRLLATVDVDRTARTAAITVRPVAGGEARTLLKVTAPEMFEAFGGLNWTPGAGAVTALKTIGSLAFGSPVTSKELWLVPVEGGSARKLNIDVNGWFAGADGIHLSPDGRHITFFSGEAAQEVWRIESHLSALAGSR